MGREERAPSGPLKERGITQQKIPAREGAVWAKEWAQDSWGFTGGRWVFGTLPSVFGRVLGLTGGPGEAWTLPWLLLEAGHLGQMRTASGLPGVPGRPRRSPLLSSTSAPALPASRHSSPLGWGLQLLGGCLARGPRGGWDRGGLEGDGGSRR